MATDWEERSDVEYDVEHMNHPRRLAQEQLVSAADGTSMVGVKQALGGKSKQPSKRTELLFQRLKYSNKRKSGVAEKFLKPNAPKIASKLTLPPPAMSALKRRAELKRALNEQAAGTSPQSTAENRTREISPAEEADSDSEYEPITISRYAGKPTAASDRGVEVNAPKVFKDAEGVAEKPNSSEGSGIPTSKGVDTEVQTMNTEQGGSAPSLSNEGQGEKQTKKKGERGRRLRLVSYSSQESQDQDGTGSRKSTRKRTAVSKFGGAMIDSIFKTRTTKGEEDRERDTN